MSEASQLSRSYHREKNPGGRQNSKKQKIPLRLLQEEEEEDCRKETFTKLTIKFLDIDDLANNSKIFNKKLKHRPVLDHHAQINSSCTLVITFLTFDNNKMLFDVRSF